ncbi:unnamed protein product, partial [Vitis vinifera]
MRINVQNHVRITTPCFVHARSRLKESLQGMRNLRKPMLSEQCIYSGNKMRSHVEAVGTCSLVLSSGFIFDLEKTFYVPSFSRNLISISRVVPLGYSFSFYETSFSLFYKSNLVGNGTFKSVSELGLFNRQAPSASTSKSCGYHRGGSSSSYQTNSTNDSGSSDQSYEGYFAYLKSSYLTKIHLMGISKGHVCHQITISLVPLRIRRCLESQRSVIVWKQSLWRIAWLFGATSAGYSGTLKKLFSAKIPDQLWESKTLMGISFSNNLLTGQLPAALAKVLTL